MKKYANCTISLLLVLSLLIAMLPVSALAQSVPLEREELIVQEDAVVKTEQSHKIVSEDVSKRGEYYKEFILDSGLRMASLYAEPVHYAEAGQWKEIDNTLKLSGDAYTNTAGVWNVSFPKQLSGNKAVTITKDGYTLSFYMAGELYLDNSSLLRSAIGTAEETLSVQSIREATAQLQKVESPAEPAQSLYPQVSEDKLSSRLQYAQVYDDTNIVYDLSGNQVKESIIISAYDPQLRGYRFTLNVGELNPVLTESGEIHLYDRTNETIVMVMPAPFLVDDGGEYCHDVQLSLTGTGTQYTLTYRLPQQWLADSSRQWPVILDPAVKASTVSSNIRDVTVFERNRSSDYTNMNLDVGYHAAFGVMRTYLKYAELPVLNSADVIVGAQLMLTHVSSGSEVNTVEVHKVLGDWESETTTWENKPNFAPTVEEYVLTQGAGACYLDITDAVRSWYEGENYGLLLKSPQLIENLNSSQSMYSHFSSSDDAEPRRPRLTIIFRNTSGLESYWDYAQASAGRAGTGYIQYYSGNLVWVHNDIGYGGNRMPVSISHIYNASYIKSNAFGLGYGWRTNYHQTLTKYTAQDGTTEKVYYLWEDADGTQHYFYQTDNGTYKDEDGLELTLTLTNGVLPGNIKDKNGNTYYFNSNGWLYRLENNQETKSSINITFLANSGQKINTITDGVGRKYQFSYYNGNLSRIGYYSTGTTEIGYVAYTYSNACPISITYQDGEVSQFTYNGYRMLESAQGVDGFKQTISYSATGDARIGRVGAMVGTKGSVSCGTTLFYYDHNRSKTLDNLGNICVRQFNDWGNTTAVYDGEGHALFTAYDSNNQTDGGNRNQVILASKLQDTVNNLLYDGSFEEYSINWGLSSNVSCTRTSAYTYHGQSAARLVSTSSTAYAGIHSSSFYAQPGETYTFSAYVKITTSGNAYIALGHVSAPNKSEKLPASQDWTRLQVSYTNNTDAAVQIECRVLISPGSTVYIDCAQLEKTETASRYNLVTNGDFSYGQTPWSKSEACNSGEQPVQESGSRAPVLDNWVFMMCSAPHEQLSLYQNVSISGETGDTFVLGGWARGNTAPLTTDNRTFSLRGTFYYTDNTTSGSKFEFDFNCDTNDWQYISGVMVAEKPYNGIRIDILYEYNVNEAFFDGIQLFKEEYGNSFTYDEEGNVKAVRDIQGKITEYEYADNNADLLNVIENDQAKVTYTYDNYHNVKTATTQEGVVYTFSYDTFGNNTAVAINGGTMPLRASASYTGDGNRLAYTVDAARKKTTYSYNPDTNVLEWVQYPLDTEDTRTEFTYDELYRVAQASMTVDSGLNFSAQYAYDDDHLSYIQTPSTTYLFSYDNAGRRSKIQVGRNTLATYSYRDLTNWISRINYANGDHVQYTYDTQGRVTKQTYGDTTDQNQDCVTYKYDNTGALATVYDSQSGISTTYYYDFTDRLMKYVETSGSNTHSVEYGFDNVNNLTSVAETINGSKRTTHYAYDDDNRISTVTNGINTRSFAYDAYGRLSQETTNCSSTPIFTKTYGYMATTDSVTAETMTTDRVYRIEIDGANYDVAFNYIYDANGNIKSYNNGLYTTRYTYDSAGQLVRENNKEANTTTIWDYDDGGNITTRAVYPYTTGVVNGVPQIESVNYIYNNTQWGDLLTSYNGVTITHDAIGNTLNDGTWTYTWQHGREMASMAKTGETWSFTYNADGLRTKRTSGGRTYQYTYVGSQLTNMTVDGHNINIFYDTNGSPVMMNLDGAFYYYVTNLQGDVVNLLNSSGEEVVRYVYDAWGNIISTTGTKADTVGLYNPLRYRGYVYDPETELYYLQSRYYNPEQGRFINADGLASTGQGLVGNNMFAYCGNNPVNNKDAFGMRYCAATTVSAESAYDRFIACDWQKKVALEKDNPTPIGTTDKGKVYLVQQESSIKTTFPGDIVVIDMRNSTISNDDPYVQIKNSALIRDRETQMQILEVLNQYETRNPSRWERNVDNASILLEWDAHNHIYSFWANTRCLHVDVNNGDRSVTYFGYWWRAIRETLGI